MGDKRVSIFSAHNNFMTILKTNRQCIELCIRTDIQTYGNIMGTFVDIYFIL